LSISVNNIPQHNMLGSYNSFHLPEAGTDSLLASTNP